MSMTAYEKLRELDEPTGGRRAWLADDWRNLIDPPYYGPPTEQQLEEEFWFEEMWPGNEEFLQEQTALAEQLVGAAYAWYAEEGQAAVEALLRLGEMRNTVEAARNTFDSAYASYEVGEAFSLWCDGRYRAIEELEQLILQKGGAA